MAAPENAPLRERLLSRPFWYRGLGNVLGRAGMRETIVREYIDVREGQRILDLGCGPAALLAYFPPVDYTGIDINPRYVEAARTAHGERGTFRAGSFECAVDLSGPFDRVLALGFLHHLSDAQAGELVALAHQKLAPGGLLVTIDCVVRTGQSRIARWLIERDRGAFVRDREQYLELVEPAFEAVDVIERDDMMRVPYSHIILRARKE